MAIITPRTPPGVFELLPRQQLAFQRMLDKIRAGYERFGYLPIETPVFELTEVLLTKSGGETEKQVYFVQSTGDRAAGRDADLALRFDLTVPLARYVALHERNLTFPFRRYQIQRVYRGERAQKGRFREFYQCDVDVIGKEKLDISYDSEIPAIIYSVFSDLEIGRFQINISNRKILQGAMSAFGINDPIQRLHVLREIDKLDKIGRDGLEASLTNGSLALSGDVAAKIGDIVSMAGSNRAILDDLAALGLDNPIFYAGLNEIQHVVLSLAAQDVPEEAIRINLAIARGLDYYTGTVYETKLLDRPEFGSVCSGGRYDNLASHYTRSQLPGVGISIGASRLFAALSDAGVNWPAQSAADVFVCRWEGQTAPVSLTMAADLRRAGIRTQVQLEADKLGHQLRLADRLGIPIAVLAGPDEEAAGIVSIKDLRSGAQVSCARAGLAAMIGGMLAEPADALPSR